MSSPRYTPHQTVIAGALVVVVAMAGFAMAPPTAAGVDHGQTLESVNATGMQASATFSIANLQGPATAKTGERITVEATVQNTGDVQGTTTVEYRLGDRTLATESVTVDAGESRSVSFRVAVPDVSDGTYLQGVFLQGTDTGQTSSLVVTRPTAAFSVLRFSGPSTLRIGERVRVEARVKNTGDADGSSEFQYRVRGRTVDTRTVAIDTGETRTVTFEGTVPEVATGTTDHGVFVDESSTGLTSQVTVQPRAAEFALSNLDAPSRAPAGDPVSVTVRVRNTGSVSGTKTLAYRIDGKEIDDKRVTLDEDQTRTITFEGTVPSVRPGTYRQGVFVEGTSTELTTNLVVEEPTVSVSDLRAPSQVGVGDRITVEATVRNTGRRTASRRVEYRIRDRRVAAETVSLDPGQRRTVSFDVTVPDLPEGTHRQGVFIADTSTGQSTSIRVTTGGPRFAVTAIDGPTGVTAGDRITVAATVSNAGGGGGTARFDYRLGDQTLATKSVQLNAGRTRQLQYNVTVPALSNGTYRQGVFVSNGRSFSTSLDVTSPPRVRPVWLVASLDAPSSATVGDRVTISATVGNRGEREASRRLEYRLGDRVVASRSVVVPAGGERSVSFDVRVPEVAGGQYTQGVYVGEGQNGRTAPLSISVGEPEFVVSDLRGPPQVGTGDSMTVRASVTNVGRAAGETELQYRLDGQVVGRTTVSLNPGQRKTVLFDVTVPDLATDTYRHGVFVDDTDRGQTSSIAVEAPETPTDGSGAFGPGFTPILALLAIAMLAALAARRR